MAIQCPSKVLLNLDFRSPNEAFKNTSFGSTAPQNIISGGRREIFFCQLPSSVETAPPLAVIHLCSK